VLARADSSPLSLSQAIPIASEKGIVLYQFPRSCLCRRYMQVWLCIGPVTVSRAVCSVLGPIRCIDDGLAPLQFLLRLSEYFQQYRFRQVLDPAFRRWTRALACPSY